MWKTSLYLLDISNKQSQSLRLRMVTIKFYPAHFKKSYISIATNTCHVLKITQLFINYNNLRKIKFPYLHLTSKDLDSGKDMNLVFSCFILRGDVSK